MPSAVTVLCQIKSKGPDGGFVNVWPASETTTTVATILKMQEELQKKDVEYLSSWAQAQREAWKSSSY
ncbi:hypothetical protein RhiirA4_477527 [Rhizophagus irregularis]|uniref:Uncharacterized protein n=1 Tax=Rhizophagus irregularis TaxID=588596 RepID=A0A2I1HDF3_9GLOM|nr:hypothetical protein RhiirA4_477527 [Rhizophagus irregularis]